MKKILVVVVVLAVALMGATSAFAVIAGSKHDLSTGTASTVGQTTAVLSSCQFCHTPHLRNNPGSPMAPLWNKSFSGATYVMYTNITGTAGPVGEASKTCLSCHDGTMSVGNVLIGTSPAINTIAGRVTAGVLQGGATGDSVGTDLTNDHPIGVSYLMAGGGASGLRQVVTPGTDPLVITGDTTKRWKLYGTTAGNMKVECGSCHDPHNTTSGQTPFLKGTSSTICSDCHSQK